MSIEFAKATLDGLRQVLRPRYISHYSEIIKTVVKDMVRNKNYNTNEAIREIFNKIAPDIGAPSKLGDFMRNTLEINTVYRPNVNYKDYRSYALDIVKPDEVVPVSASFGELEEATKDSQPFKESNLDNNQIPMDQSKMQENKVICTNIAAIFKLDKLYQFQRIFCIAELYKRSYIVLKSINRSNNNDSTTSTKFKWIYSNSTTPAQGYFNTLERINNICAIRLYQPALPITVDVNTTINILIDEFSTQSFLLTNTRRFHFIGTTLMPSYPYSVLSIRGSGDGIFNFAYPIQILETLTFSFAINETLIEMPTNPLTSFFLDLEILYLRNDTEDTQIISADNAKK
jgi:hypothetical protein